MSKRDFPQAAWRQISLECIVTVMPTKMSPLNELLDPVGECLTPEVAQRLVELRAPTSVQAYMDELAAKNTEGKLSESERAQYESLLAAGTIIAVLQSKARQLLRNSSSST